MTEAGVKLLDELMESPLDGARYAHHVVSLRLSAIETEAGALDVEALRLALHAAGIGCKPNVVHCRATHKGHAERIAREYAAEVPA